MLSWQLVWKWLGPILLIMLAENLKWRRWCYRFLQEIRYNSIADLRRVDNLCLIVAASFSLMPVIL